ncbi:MAG TPA: holo-ACP synthase [Gemmatimonadales bacterium]|nr:holo-ACP synthase [Gemmatimonadales bacterium]
MAVLGVGIDLVPASRVEALIARHGERAMRRLFTPAERQRAADYSQASLHLAARIAAKEAAYKALSGDFGASGIGWQDLEVRRGPDGRPDLVFHGAAERRMQDLGVTRCHLSLTHAGGVAAAVVILE